MPIKYVPFIAESIEGQAVLGNFNQILRYKGADETSMILEHGMPLYKRENQEIVGENTNGNMVTRGECFSACAYLKVQGTQVGLVYIDSPFFSGAELYGNNSDCIYFYTKSQTDCILIPYINLVTNLIARFSRINPDGKKLDSENLTTKGLQGGGYSVAIDKFISDRALSKITEFNQKSLLNSSAKKPYKPIEISEDGLELIEFLSLDCTAAEGEWHYDSEIKIDKNCFVIIIGTKIKDFWDGSIRTKNKPLGLKIRNICGDETVWKFDIRLIKSIGVKAYG